MIISRTSEVIFRKESADKKIGKLRIYFPKEIR